MVVLGGLAVSYERGTPVQAKREHFEEGEVRRRELYDRYSGLMKIRGEFPICGGWECPLVLV